VTVIFKMTVTWTVLNPADKARHDKLVSLVERMLELHKRNPRLPQEQEMVKRALGRAPRMQDRACGGRED